MTTQQAIKILMKGNDDPSDLDFTYEEYCIALDIAIQALEDLQKYKATGFTPEWIEEMQIDYVAKSAILEEYKAIGTVDQLKEMKKDYACALSDWRQYRKVGTVEEFNELKEKADPKKQGNINDCNSHLRLSKAGFLCCSKTNKVIRYPLISLTDLEYCPRCGKHLNWE